MSLESPASALATLRRLQKQLVEDAVALRHIRNEIGDLQKSFKQVGFLAPAERLSNLDGRITTIANRMDTLSSVLRGDLANRRPGLSAAKILAEATALAQQREAEEAAQAALQRTTQPTEAEPSPDKEF